MIKVTEMVPKLSLTPQDINGLLDQVHEYHETYNDLFQRREQRQNSKLYLYGLLSPEIENKAIEPMMLKLKGDNPNGIRSMQNFMSEGSWDDHLILKHHRIEVSHDLGDKDGVFIVDGSDFPKQGTESVGVKRQYCGQLGKTANCQAGVFLSYASSKGYTLLDRRLYLPQEWIEDETHAERRLTCGIPNDMTFKRKPELALEMVKDVHQEGTLPGRWVTCDEAFGRSTDFLDSIAGLNLWYYAEVPHDTQFWLTRPDTEVPQYLGMGRKPTKEQVVDSAPSPQTVVEIATSLSNDKWTRQTIKEGSKGPMVADFAFLRVIAVRDKLSGPDVWLVFRKNPEKDELKTYVSNAPVNIPEATLIHISGMRWPIETAFEDSKQLIGMGDYQVRSWRGWNHHMTLCILAHFFLVRLKLRLGDKAPALTLPQVKHLLTGILPKREFDAQWVLEVLGYLQRRNYEAYISHRKRRLEKLAQSMG
jgi:SRSO17 transposase